MQPREPTLAQTPSSPTKAPSANGSPNRNLKAIAVLVSIQRTTYSIAHWRRLDDRTRRLCGSFLSASSKTPPPGAVDQRETYCEHPQRHPPSPPSTRLPPS